MKIAKASANRHPSGGKQSTQKLRVAIVGCGSISEHYMRALGKLDCVAVVAAVDILPDVLAAFQARHGIAEIYSDYRDMLANVSTDMVCVCTPNLHHAPISIAALKAGAHVLTEKPMALTPQDCVKMIHAAEAAKRKLAVGFQYRFHPVTQMLKRAADAGQFGSIMHVKCQALRRRGVPNWGVFGQKRLQGGGPLIDIGVHVLEMAHYVMGSPRPASASGNIWTFDGNRPNHVPCM